MTPLGFVSALLFLNLIVTYLLLRTNEGSSLFLARAQTNYEAIVGRRAIASVQKSEMETTFDVVSKPKLPQASRHTGSNSLIISKRPVGDKRQEPEEDESALSLDMPEWAETFIETTGDHMGNLEVETMDAYLAEEIVKISVAVGETPREMGFQIKVDEVDSGVVAEERYQAERKPLGNENAFAEVDATECGHEIEYQNKDHTCVARETDIATEIHENENTEHAGGIAKVRYRFSSVMPRGEKCPAIRELEVRDSWEAEIVFDVEQCAAEQDGEVRVPHLASTHDESVTIEEIVNGREAILRRGEAMMARIAAEAKSAGLDIVEKTQMVFTDILVV